MGEVRGLATNPQARRRWDVLGLALVLALASVVGMRLHASRDLDWPSSGLPVLAGTPEEAVHAFLEALANDDTASAAQLASSHYGGVDGPALARQLADGLRKTGALTRWLLVSRRDGEPVLITVYARFALAGDAVLTAEVFGEAAGWRVGNLRMGDGVNRAWKPPDWETASTSRLLIHAWPGYGRDLSLLAERGEEALDMALRPLAGAAANLLASEERPVAVYIYDSSVSLSAAFGESVPEWVTGVWRGGAVHLITQGPNTRDGRPLLLEYLTHELNHAMLSRYVQGRAAKLVSIPAWLSEGTAGVAARQLTGARRTHFAAAAARSEPPSLADLEERFAGSTVEFRYEYSFALCEYLCGRFGLDTLQRVLDAICDGAAPNTALETVTGQGFAALVAEWHSWLRGGLVWTSF